MAQTIGAPATGSIRADTFSRNRYGQYTRNRSIPVNPNTSKQSAQRARFSEASQAWQSLNANQQAAWGPYAQDHPLQNKLGETIILSPSAMYTRIRLQALAAGITPSADPPAEPAFVFTALSAVASVDTTGPTRVLTLTGTVNQPAGYVAIISAAGQTSLGRSYPPPFKQLSAADASALTTPIALNSLYQAIFGVLQIGRRVFLNVKLVSDDGVWDGVNRLVQADVVDVTP